jgi:hypothetical protein
MEETLFDDMTWGEVLIGLSLLILWCIPILLQELFYWGVDSIGKSHNYED